MLAVYFVVVMWEVSVLLSIKVVAACVVAVNVELVGGYCVKFPIALLAPRVAGMVLAF